MPCIEGYNKKKMSLKDDFILIKVLYMEIKSGTKWSFGSLHVSSTLASSGVSIVSNTKAFL